MNEILSRSWWILALRGVIAIMFGVLTLIWPGLTLLVLVALFAAYALLGGAVMLIGAIQNRKVNEDWWLLLLFGLVSIAAGGIAIVHPNLTALVLVLVVAANALVTGVLDIAIAIRLRRSRKNEWRLILSGIASMVFGVLVFLFPFAGALALATMIGLYAIIVGALLLSLAFQVRSKPSHTTERRVTPDRRVAAAH